jgi:hypothetical protein
MPCWRKDSAAAGNGEITPNVPSLQTELQDFLLQAIGFETRDGKRFPILQGGGNIFKADPQPVFQEKSGRIVKEAEKLWERDILPFWRRGSDVHDKKISRFPGVVAPVEKRGAILLRIAEKL